ncbi:hypothetical protein K2173_004309 [Erythroxylum novogranatense]|uniref:Uncharacterized protein n=1 Tax=Erythroxylum novogranatense TaxID=1862640 RepID=A0AAV8U5L2_9ROSI|nr:hypothetical protein K2173_004309 [Erythroxylum novogranatense]
MTRRCSHCCNNGHNSRTCPTRSTGTSSSIAGVKLFGVRLTDGSIIKKSASTSNLSTAQYHCSSSTAASPHPDSPPVSDRNRHSSDGYLSDDPTHGNGPVTRRGERKKGVPWTEEEHRMFLIGLQKLGKGDWRGIARNYVVSRTPTQVASHAQKYFIRQTNENRRKRRSSLFDMVHDMGIEPETVPEERELPTSHAKEIDDGNALPSFNLIVNTDYEPMETADQEVNGFDGTALGSTEMKPTVPRPSKFPIVSGSSEFMPFVPGFIPAYIPVPYPNWSQHTATPDERNAAETCHHEVLKPVPVAPRDPVNINELLGISHLSLGEIEKGCKEPSPLSLKLTGESSRQSAFRASAPVSESGIRKSKECPIQAV